MNIKSLLFAAFIFPFVSFGQISNFNTVAGTPLMVKKYKDVQGSPYLEEGKWFQGTIFLVNADRVENVMIRYNAHEDNLEFLRNEKPLVIESSMLEGFEFTVVDTEMGTSRRFYFKSGASLDDQLSEKGFYVVHYEGDNIKVLEKIKIDQISVTPPEYGQSDYKKFIETSEAFLIKDGKVESIKLNRRNVSNKFPDYKKDIKEFISKNGIDFSEASEVQALFSFIESLENS